MLRTFEKPLMPISYRIQKINEIWNPFRESSMLDRGSSTKKSSKSLEKMRKIAKLSKIAQYFAAV